MNSNGLHATGSSMNQKSVIRGRQKRDIALAARTDACILLSGKAHPARELAYVLHLASGWRHGAFTVIDCASADPALESNLMEALSPADHQHRPNGMLELKLVQAGTVLLQEVNRLPLGIQRRLASRLSDLSAPDALCRSRRRVMASTSEPLLDRVGAGTFDDNLYYRLNVLSLIHI